MIDFKNPIIISIVVTIVTSVLSGVILYLSKPLWIKKLTKKGTYKIDTPLLISYSITFGLALGVVSLLLSCNSKLL